MKNHLAMPGDAIDAVRRWVDHQPHAIAVVDSRGDLSYAALWRDAQAWAEALRPLVHTADALVAVLRPRDATLPAAQLGAWLAGAAYLPLDPSLPDGRIADILDAAGCAAVVSTDHLAGRVAGPPVVTMPGRPSGETEPRTGSGLAYVIYTSGSTGAPKGVEIEHRGLRELLDWYAHRFELAPGVRVAMTAGLGFDQSVLDVWGTLCSGSTLVIPEEHVLADVDALVAFLDTRRIAHTYLPAVIAEQLFTNSARPGTLRTLDVGGEALRRRPPPAFPCAVHNGYGPTETTILATMSNDLRGYSGSGPLPIGRAVAGLSLLLVDEGGATIDQPGRDGELLVAGTGVMRGYRGDPTATRDAFVHRGGQRWYRTGDVCRWVADDELAFVGRHDGQVKVRGYRIEVGEIEHALLACDGVRQAAVVAVGEGDRRALHGWIVGTADPLSVRAAISTRLPDYMVPATLRSLHSLPMTANGKIDRQLLAASASETAGAGHEYLSGVEEVVAGVWADVLSRWPQRTDEFLAIGGNSLAAAQVTARLRGVFGVTLTLAALLEQPVLRDYAAEIDRLLRESEGLPADPPVPIARGGALPLSYLQENRLTKEVRALRSGRPRMLNFVPVVLDVRGDVSDDRIEAALAALVRRHESLRTGFRVDAVANQFSVSIAEQAPTRLERRSLDQLAEPNRIATAIAAQARLMNTPLDLAEPPLWRVALYRFARDHAVLILVVDHLVVDGWAGQLLVDALIEELGDGIRARDTLPLQHVDWVAWQRRRLDGAARTPLLRYWHDALAGTQPFPALALPVATANDPPGRHLVTVGLSPHDTRRLLDEVAARNATPLVAALHAVAMGWSVATGERDLVIHMPTANRGLPDFERIIGWLAHSVVLRLRPDPGEPVHASFARTRGTLLDALRHQDVPLPLLVQELQPGAYGHTRRRDRLFFSYETVEQLEQPVVGGVVRRLLTPDQESIAEPGVSFYATLAENELRIEIVTDPALVDQGFVGQLAAAVSAVLHGLARPTGRPELASVVGGT
ncbi:MAG: amino acid adenylation domain-containing protein [Egibacteraceae bacterium]